MKITFNHFKQLFLESILNEDKSRLIDRLVLPDIEDEEEKQNAREEMKAFFKKYNTWENKLDWNKLSSITYADFEKIRDQANQTKSAQKREIAVNINNIFKSNGNRKFEIVGENDNWLFITPLTWEAAVYCDSSENQGAGAKWCIGYEKNDEHWLRYIQKNSLFIMAFNKNFKSLNQRELQTNLKFMIEKEKDGNINVWNQADNSSRFNDGRFDISISEINSMFDKVKYFYQKIKEEIEEKTRQQIEEKIKNLKNISRIEQYYFSDNEKKLLTSINIPENITEIAGGAFRECTLLTKVTIPDSVKSIGRLAFYDCNSNLYDTKTYPGLILVDGWVVDCKKSIHTLDLTKVRGILENVFHGCKNITNVTLGNNIQTIGSDTFKSCENLQKITIPEGVTTIGEYAFSSCTKLKNINISSTVTSIGKGAFYWCSSLTDISIAKENPIYSSKNGLLLNKDGTTLIAGINGDVVIPNGVTSIGRNAFWGHQNLASVTIPDSVTSIGESAFGYCSSLKNVTIPDSVKTIERNAFVDCHGLISITLSNNIKNINNYMFSNCYSLKNVTIGNSVINIGQHVFSGCGNLVSITIPDSVTNIEEEAIYSCKNLTTVVIGKGIKNIDNGVFKYCSNLRNLIFRGKIMSQVKAMDNYPWEIENPERVINIEK